MINQLVIMTRAIILLRFTPSNLAGLRSGGRFNLKRRSQLFVAMFTSLRLMCAVGDAPRRKSEENEAEERPFERNSSKGSAVHSDVRSQPAPRPIAFPSCVSPFTYTPSIGNTETMT